MTPYALAEWGLLPHGARAGQVPEAVAVRLAASARASSLARRGVMVLDHRREGLRAGQAVGVVVAEGAVCEILPKIGGEGPDARGEHVLRERLIGMLGVAHDLDIDAGRLAALGLQGETLLELLIGLFADALTEGVRRGLPRRYVAHEEDLPALRGRLDVVRQFTRHATAPQRLACRYDALSPDIALNRIMKAAVTRLAAVSRAPANQRRLRELGHVYADISAVPARALDWDVPIDRSNARWRTLLGLARLLLGGRHQTTALGEGAGYALLFEMNVLFERYVARMLARVLAGTGLSARAQGGGRYCLSDEDGKPRFQTWPDIIVEQGAIRRLVIDTKWKRMADVAEDGKGGASQADVYQMMAYGRVYGCGRLMLLYPHHAGLGEAATRRDFTLLPAGGNDVLTLASLDVTSHAAARAGLAALVADLMVGGAVAA